jgi:hypothetical protein
MPLTRTITTADGRRRSSAAEENRPSKASPCEGFELNLHRRDEPSHEWPARRRPPLKEKGSRLDAARARQSESPVPIGDPHAEDEHLWIPKHGKPDVTSQGSAHARFDRPFDRATFPANLRLRDGGAPSLFVNLDYVELLAEVKPQKLQPGGPAVVRPTRT